MYRSHSMDLSSSVDLSNLSSSVDLSNLEAGFAHVSNDTDWSCGMGTALTVTIQRRNGEMLGISVGSRSGELIVNGIVNGGAAEKQGIKEGDVITHCNGTECWRLVELKSLIASCVVTRLGLRRPPERIVLVSSEGELMLNGAVELVVCKAHSDNMLQIDSEQDGINIKVNQLLRVDVGRDAFDLVMAEQTLRVYLRCGSEGLSAWVEYFRDREVPVEQVS